MKNLFCIVLLLSTFCSGNTIDLHTEDPPATIMVAKGSMALLLGGLSMQGVIDAIEKKKPISFVFGVLLGWSAYWFGKSAQDDYHRRRLKENTSFDKSS